MAQLLRYFVGRRDGLRLSDHFAPGGYDRARAGWHGGTLGGAERPDPPCGGRPPPFAMVERLP